MELKHEHLWPIVHARLREYMAASDWDIETVASGTGSAPDTVIGWLGNDKEPNGERLIKLWHLLAASGCDSPELKRLGAPNFLCGQLLTFGVVSLEELHEIIGVTNAQAVLRMLRGSEPMRWHHDYNELNELYGDQLTEALTRVQKQGVTSTVKAVVPTEQLPSLPEAGELAAIMSASADKLLITAALLGAVRPLVSHLNSDDCTPQDRSKLRSLLGDDGMFELSNHFHALCSERARNDGR